MPELDRSECYKCPKIFMKHDSTSILHFMLSIKLDFDMKVNCVHYLAFFYAWEIIRFQGKRMLRLSFC